MGDRAMATAKSCGVGIAYMLFLFVTLWACNLAHIPDTVVSRYLDLGDLPNIEVDAAMPESGWAGWLLSTSPVTHFPLAWSLARKPTRQVMQHADAFANAWRWLYWHLWVSVFTWQLGFMLAVCVWWRWWQRFLDWGMGAPGDLRERQRMLRQVQDDVERLLGPDERPEDCVLAYTHPSLLGTQFWRVALGMCLFFTVLLCLLTAVCAGSVLCLLEGGLGLLRVAPSVGAAAVLTLLMRRMVGPAPSVSAAFVAWVCAGSGFLGWLWMSKTAAPATTVALVACLTLGWLLALLWDIRLWWGRERRWVLALTDRRLVLCGAYGLRRRLATADAMDHPVHVAVDSRWMGYALHLRDGAGKAIVDLVVPRRCELDRFLEVLRGKAGSGSLAVDESPKWSARRELRPALLPVVALLLLGTVPTTHLMETLVHRGLFITWHALHVPEVTSGKLGDALKSGDFEALWNRMDLALAVMPDDPILLAIKAVAGVGIERYDEVKDLCNRAPQFLGGRCGRAFRWARAMARSDSREVSRWQEVYREEGGRSEEAFRHYFIARLWLEGIIGSGGSPALSEASRRRRAAIHLVEALAISPDYTEARTLWGRLERNDEQPLRGIPSARERAETAEDVRRERGEPDRVLTDPDELHRAVEDFSASQREMERMPREVGAPLPPSPPSLDQLGVVWIYVEGGQRVEYYVSKSGEILWTTTTADPDAAAE